MSKEAMVGDALSLSARHLAPLRRVSAALLVRAVAHKGRVKGSDLRPMRPRHVKADEIGH